MDNESDAFLQLRLLCNSEVKILKYLKIGNLPGDKNVGRKKIISYKTTLLAKSTHDYTIANA